MHKILIVCALLFSHLLSAKTSQELTFLTRSDAAEAVGQHFFLSYARSGTNLTSCYLQYLTGKPIKFLFDENSFLAENRLNVPIDYSKPILYRTHFPRDLKKIDKKNNKLLYILRNCKECIFRHNYKQLASPEEYRDMFKEDDVIIREYMEGLEIYDQWEPSLRLLVHYEDLLTDPMTVVTQILNFFEEPILRDLSSDLLEQISAQALASYDKQHRAISGGSHSKGQDLLYHTKNLPHTILREIDSTLAENYPGLWKKYLQRYKT
jgi:hypothetical protein